MKFLLDEQNKPIANFSAAHKFTKLEEELNIVDCPVSEVELDYIMKCCYWKDGEFVLTLSNIPFSGIKNNLKNKKSFTPLDNKEKVDLQDTHLNICSTKDLSAVRQEYLEKTMSLIEYEGFDDVVAALKNGCYDDIAEALKNLPNKSKKIVLEVFPKELVDLLTNVWKVFPKDLV